MPRPSIICLTPVLNEAWILERFLQCASLWADHIIVADQGSTDGSRAIAGRFPKVRLVENPRHEYSEEDRQALLLRAAREIDGPRVMLALDADEFLTANVLDHPEWESIVNAPPGTVIRFLWPEVGTGFDGLRYVMHPGAISLGFVDDGSAHRGRRIHSFRVPVPAGAPTLRPNAIRVMHYCQVDRRRFESRIRWYECWEHLQGIRRAADIYRFYQRELRVPPARWRPLPAAWTSGYEDRGIDMTSVMGSATYRWDAEVLKLFETHGTARFSRLPIWGFDWDEAWAQLHPDGPAKRFDDPRSLPVRAVHWWLRRTQAALVAEDDAPPRRRFSVRFVEGLLRAFGW